MKSVKISGTDYFFLVLLQHMKKQGSTSYDCRFIMKLGKHLALEALQAAIQQSQYFELLEQTRLSFPKFKIPRWELTNERISTIIKTHKSTSDEIPTEVLNKQIELKDDNLYRFDLIHHPTCSTLVFSWHHILMDGFGANTLLHSLSHTIENAERNFLVTPAKEGLRQQWSKLMKTKDFLKDISKGSLQKIKELNTSQKVDFVELKFNAKQTAEIKEQVIKHSRGGIDTPYFLGIIALAYYKTLEQRVEKLEDIFVPVPMELRKAGAKGPILSNQHTLLFFRIKANLRNDKAALIKDLNEQFFNQVKTQMPHNYASMINLLRLLPTAWYYKLVKGPNDESLAGFLYSKSPSPNNLSGLLDCHITDATVLPPNTSPPGISFQMMTFGGNLKFVIQFSESCFAKVEIKCILEEMQKELLAPND